VNDAGEDAMTARIERALAALAARAHPGLRAGCRTIRAGDEEALSPAEAAPLAGAVESVRRASGAARIVARRLLADLGAPAAGELPRLVSGAPCWPPGFVGSLAHDEAVAVAAVARSGVFPGLGIDVEPALPLPAELLDLVATPAEQGELAGDLIEARLLFCAKEAVYKATNPIDGVFLEHRDVEVRLGPATASTRTGHALRLFLSRSPRLIALATLD
jgi:4'-phosphopantetheinyl transferase EntD